jgi:hypothetical protein
MSLFIKNSFNLIYNKLSNIFYVESEEEKIHNLLNIFFKDYEEIMNENKFIFNIHLYKINNIIEDNSINAGLNNYSKTFYNSNNISNTNKSLYYLYKFSFGYENNKQLKDDYINIDIYLPDGMTINYIINKKYYYKISSIQNNVKNVIKDIKLYNDEPTFRSIITEIIDIIKNI